MICIRKADWAILWNGETHSHGYERNIDIAFDELGIRYIGPHYSGEADRDIEGSGMCAIPGLINIHAHPSSQPVFRGFTEEFGNPRLFNSGRDEFRQSFVPDLETQHASSEFALCELLKSGVTSVVDLSFPYEGWVDIIEKSGIRAWIAPMYRSARWYAESGQETLYEWDEKAGIRAFAAAAELMDAVEARKNKRLSALVSPAQVDTCTEDLLRESADLARATGRRLHVHASQSFAEFNGMTRRHNMTPVEWLARIGFLSKHTIIGHGVFTDEHPWLHWPTRRDLRLIAENGTSIAHCPTPFARDGTLLHDLAKYRRKGINIGTGTDTHPHNLIEELRWADILGRVAAGPAYSLQSADFLYFATIGGADAVGRTDIGRLEAGCRSDLVLLDVKHPSMQPLHDPWRSLMYGAADRAVIHSFVDGRQLVENGRVLPFDHADAVRRLTEGQKRAVIKFPEYDPEGRSIRTIQAPSLPGGHEKVEESS